ncbi:uncharacterized protein LOC111003142 [Pieris rapae]|uniref:uncharacterized protein LOC111003142 n=1 Tax=Pieris rapae TaxID=64459 RepID=UPI000B9262BE|nr:uncharacterized protein LOC111003142 [Pieris rapae]XP_022129212.1 uncharacterized protein LOC111003142 [Pieris rapae]XP_022129218.1 uncharacterized protein LOC111003142 [Pieris rapae]XP_045487574.1 uncharacterized protein LOC111003142 [Pieris rapae]
MSGKRKHIDMYLGEIFKEFISLKDKDLKKSQEVFNSVFEQVKQKMEEQCNYFSKYAKQVLYAGSVYDGIKVTKLDEFDMNIVIRLPINYDDGEDGIILENAQPGFVKMKISRPFDNLDKQKDWENCHKVTRDWRDSDKYLLQNKFRQWLHSIIQKALNAMNNEVTVNGVKYDLKYKSSGPAYTLNIENKTESFYLDVDLVPVIRFMLPRWPKGYRNIDDDKAKDWLVVPKPNKALDAKEQNQCWRLSFQEQERKVMKNLKQLKVVIRLVKKLRDVLGLKYIASYYIKTLFLWKIQKINDDKYWENNIGLIFKDMIDEFYKAVDNKCIPYFWNEKNNLIGAIKPTILKVYADKLNEVLKTINANDLDKVPEYLLTSEELETFKKSEFYLRLQVIPVKLSIDSTDSPSSQSKKSDNSKDMNNVIENLMDKVALLTKRVNEQEMRIKALELKNGQAEIFSGVCYNNTQDLLVFE